jgi:hypothetical protein
LIAKEQRADRAAVVGDLNAITTRRPEVERTPFKDGVSFDLDSPDKRYARAGCKVDTGAIAV